MSNWVSECIPSSPEAISKVPPFIIALAFEWIESSSESILKVPPSIIILVVAFKAFILVLSSVDVLVLVFVFEFVSWLFDGCFISCGISGLSPCVCPSGSCGGCPPWVCPSGNAGASPCVWPSGIVGLSPFVMPSGLWPKDWFALVLFSLPPPVFIVI